MRKEQAIKILRTNFHRNMCKDWVKFQLPIIIPLLVVNVIVYVFTHILCLTISWPKIILPPSSLRVEHVVPPIFTATIAACSIIIGFFSVSVYTLLRSLEAEIENVSKDLVDLNFGYKGRLEELKDELERMEKKRPEKEEDIKEYEAMLALARARFKETSKKFEDGKELLSLNRDARAHQQEHAGRFMLTYIYISFYILLSNIVLFLATPISSNLVDLYIDLVLFSVNMVFTGLCVFLWKFTTYTVHQEMY